MTIFIGGNIYFDLKKISAIDQGISPNKKAKANSMKGDAASCYIIQGDSSLLLNSWRLH
jgi:hypothetical protein